MPAPLTAAELADALHVSVWTVADWAREGRIPFSQVGQSRWFDLAEVLAATRKPARPVDTRPPVLASQDDEFTELRQWLTARRAGRPSATKQKTRRV